MNWSRPAGLLAATLALLSTNASAQVSAEPWFRGGTLMITLEAGGAAFSDFDRSQVRPVSDEIALGDFRRRVSARTSGSVGAWASYWLGHGWGIRAGIGYVPSAFDVWNEESARRVLEPSQPGVMAEPRHSSLDIWMANAAVVFRFPRSFGRVVPYGIVGGGVIRYSASDDASLPPEARSNFADGVRQVPAGLLGIGATIPLQRRNLLLSFELTDHISRPPFSGAEGQVFEISGVPLLMDPDDGAGASDNVGLTSHVRLSLGLTLPLR